MMETLREYSRSIFRLPETAVLSLGRHKLGFFAFLLTFVLTSIFLNVTFQRLQTIHDLKKQISGLSQKMEEFHLDFAYQNLRFNVLFTQPLLEADNFQIYSRDADRYWRFETPQLKVNTGFWNPRRLGLNFGKQQTLQIGTTAYDLSSPQLNLEFELSSQGRPELILAKIKDLNVKNFAKINQLNLAGRAVENVDNSAFPAVFETHLELKDVTLNGFLNYPLSSQIDRFYVKANLIRPLPQNDSLRAALGEWLHNGGQIEIPAMIVNWRPFAMVARGDLNFNENLSPRLHLDTSSKALITLLDDLLKYDYLERKGVFVTKILLSNKAFKLKDSDQHLTIVTPVDYRDGRWSVERITVRNAQPAAPKQPSPDHNDAPQ